MTASAPYQQRRSRLRGVGAVLAATTTGVASIALLFFPGLLLYGLRCDDACGAPGYFRGWTEDRSAWQWDFQFWGLAVPGTIAGLLAVALLTLHRPRAAAAALAACALAWLAYPALWFFGGREGVFSLSDTIAHPWTWLPYTVMVGGGAVAIWVERRWLRAFTESERA
jgi:hypothetical protein